MSELRLRDITTDWVKQNFDINKERKTKTHHHDFGTIYEWRLEVPMDFEAYMQQLRTAVEERVKLQISARKLELKDCKMMVSTETEWDYDSSEDYLSLKVEFEAVETDNEVISRIKSREKAKITRAKTAQEKAIKKEEQDRKEFERLSKKFGNQSNK